MSDKNRVLVINKHDIINYFIIIVSALISLYIVFSIDAIYIHIITMWSVAIIAISISKFDFYHPYLWFSLFFTLYSTANAILINAGVRTSNYSREQILYPLIALIVSLLVIGPARTTGGEEKNRENIANNQSLEFAIIVLGFLTLIFSFIILQRGYVSKIQMREEGDFYYKTGSQIVRFFTFFCIVYSDQLLASKSSKLQKILVFGGMVTLVFSLFTSERDVFFRYGYTIILLLFGLKVLKPWHLFVVIPASVVAMAASVVVKHFFLRGIVHERTGSLLYDFLSSDFTACGRNLQYLLDYPWTKGYLGIKTLFTEFFNPLLFGVSTVNPDKWFNYEVYNGPFKGNAFTLVGTGYAIKGIAGIIIVFVIVSVLIRFFYRNSFKNKYWQTSYIYFSSAVVFSFRQSLRTVTGTLVKHILLSVLICIALDKHTITFSGTRYK